MTLGTQTLFVERLARLTGAVTIATASDATKTYLNEGVREFSKRVHGLSIESFIVLAPTFDLTPNHAINFAIKGGNSSITATDVPVVSTTLNNATPTTVMAHLASNINAVVAGVLSSACVAVGWSASTWSFYVGTGVQSATNWTVGSPVGIMYMDACSEVFGGPLYKKGGTLTGGFPVNCTMENSLPAGFLEIQRVFYDRQELRPAPYDLFLRPLSVGLPVYYHIKNKVIRLDPVPSHQDWFKIFYTGFPVDLGVDGSSDSVACPLPEEVHMAPAYYAAACLLEESHEFDKSIYYQRKFNDMLNDYKIREANNSPTMFPDRETNIPRVIMSSI